ncbi:MAG: hypothetical protein ACKEQK_00375 [Candidatus Hodgkinia cicadicola]
MLSDARAYRLEEGVLLIETLIGLEIHTKVSDVMKVFSGPCGGVWPIDEGLPGSLPTFQPKELNFMFELIVFACCDIATCLSFTRKSYNCIDIALGYQITQCFWPIASNGILSVHRSNSLGKGDMLRIRLLRFNIEHDSANFTSTKRYVSYLRAGISLLEIVTAPDLDSPSNVRVALVKLKLLLKTIGLCLDVTTVRFDLNYTLAKPLSSLSRKVELKNISCFGSIDRLLNIAMLSLPRSLTKPLTCDHGNKIVIATRAKDHDHDYKRIQESNLNVTKVWYPMIKAVPMIENDILAFADASAYVTQNVMLLGVLGFKRIVIALKVSETKTNRLSLQERS